MLLLAWNPYYLSFQGINILRVDGNAILFETSSNNISMGCDFYDEGMEFPFWDINFDLSHFVLIPRRAHEGWCKSIKTDFKNLISKAKGGKLTIMGSSISQNNPPELPGLSMYYHYIKNESGDCMGHFEQSCSYTLDQNWYWVGLSDWSEMDSMWFSDRY